MLADGSVTSCSKRHCDVFDDPGSGAGGQREHDCRHFLKLYCSALAACQPRLRPAQLVPLHSDFDRWGTAQHWQVLWRDPQIDVA